MSELKGFQKRYLRARAHGLKPIVQVGQNGVSEALVRFVDEALNAHELIKVRFNEHKGREEKALMSAVICKETGSTVAGMVGHTVILFRPHPTPEKRKIALPATDPSA
ncbi:MAG: ribosome assembly RNA-binding protein YhbY [Desulfobacterales bacterium]|jgi:RNA-binding protein